MRRGERIGAYEILERLGVGGMGEVWLVRDTRLGRKVALKRLPPELAGHPERQSRFENEARMVAALNHPNIVTLFSVEQVEGVHFLTMEYVEGKTLDALIGEGGVALETFFEVALPIAEALATAHRQGITHRDLKPGNVMVTDDRRVKVLDFGIAKQWGAEARSQEPADAAATRTRTGMLLGTIPYMAPEQLHGLGTDARSDVFSLGILFYELLAGVRPFGGRSAAETASAILRDEPAALDEPLPQTLAAVLRRCLHKEPEKRYESAAALLGDLEEARREFVEGRMGRTAHETPRRAQRTIAVADFVNLAQDPDLDWLCGGIPETITVDLKKIPQLGVVSREKVVPAWQAMREQTGGRDDIALGRRLGVEGIIGGGFQKLGRAIRITARHVEVASGEVAGSVKVDGTLEEIFALQDRIVAELLQLLELESAGEPSRETFAAGTRPTAGVGKIEAFECFAKGIREVARMHTAAFGEAEKLLRRAVELEPEYAQAHAGLGRLKAMRYIATTDERDLQAAIEHLERAIEIDAGFAAPYPWLCYCLVRAGRLGAAVAAGRRGVQLEPDDTHPHYFLGVALWAQATWLEFRQGHWDEVFEHLARAAQLAPRYQAAHQLLGGALLLRGRYAEARPALERAAEIEETDDYETARFVGGHVLLGRLCFREGRMEEAERLARRSIEILRHRDHVYSAVMRALSHGLAADVLQRVGRPTEALTELRQALEQLLARPKSLGIGGVLVRTRLALARCLHALHMKREALGLYEEATDLFRRRKGYDFSWTMEVTDADLYVELALYHAVAGQADEAARALEKARECGWGDRGYLEAEPLLAPVLGRHGAQGS